MIPSPPNCIRTIITTSPKCVNVPGIETVERPVTVAQLTATKNALTREIPSVVAHGSSSNAVPNRHEPDEPVDYEARCRKPPEQHSPQSRSRNARPLAVYPRAAGGYYQRQKKIQSTRGVIG